MDATIIVGGESVTLTSDVLDVFLRAVNRYVDTGDIAILEDGISDDVLADAKEASGDLRLLLARLAAK